MVRVATRKASTDSSPAQHRETARTILLTSTGSDGPSRLRTCMLEAVSSAGAVGAERSIGRPTRSRVAVSGLMAPPGGCRRCRTRPGRAARPLPKPPARLLGQPPPSVRAVAGFRTRGLPPATKPLDLPTDASQAHRPVLMTAVVPTYRCGAAPDSHRIPCCLLRPLPPGGTTRAAEHI